MLSKPHYGWTEFALVDKRVFSLSYLTDIAFDWLTQAIHGLEQMDVFSVHGFCEPGRMICTVSYWSCYIVFEEEDRNPQCLESYHVNVSMIDFCKQLYEDISSNLEEWVHWDDSILRLNLEDDDEEGFIAAMNQNRLILQNKLDKLKNLIDENEENFGDGRCFF